MRRVYLDHIRCGTVLLVVAYHVCYLFNGLGVPGGIPDAESIPLLDGMASIVYPWMMALLFAVAGMSARYSLQRRSGGGFLRERARKLLVPSTLGLLVLHWVTGYLNIWLGGALAYIPPALLYPICALSGIGPLWFVQMLFLFSAALLLLRRTGAADRLWAWGGRLRLPGLVLLAVPIFLASQVGNVPVLTMYRFGIYSAAFLIGYAVLSHERVQEQLERSRMPLLAAAALAGAGYALCFWGRDYTAPECLQSPLTNSYLWLAILAILGCGRRHWNRETARTRALCEAGYGFYLLHYPVLLAVCSALTVWLDLPVLWNYAIALAAGFALTAILYALLRRIPMIRFLVLGQSCRSTR